MVMMGTLIVTVTLPRLRFHDLRHSVASLLIAAGVELVEVSLLARSLRTAGYRDLYSHLQQQTAAKGCASYWMLLSVRSASNA